MLFNRRNISLGFVLAGAGLAGCATGARKPENAEKENAVTITRINTFTAQAGQGDALVAALKDVLPAMKAAEGFHSYEILQGTPNTNAVAVIEVWETIDAHKAAASLIPPQDFQKIMPLLAGPPAGDYYEGR